ncbi:MAG TPA: D-aminoacyl-tRNA deacylase [Nitriliruptorales bacterium]|nr:D-aminoacyl-tRNA deacylase [Nitriliruptorales bacterium]
MRVLLQRVTHAEVEVNGRIVGAIGPGVLLLVGVARGDDPAVADRLAAKVWHLRVFADAEGAMNRSLADTSRAALVVSQFTLYGDTRRGRRPSWVAAAAPDEASALVDRFVAALQALGADVATGRFGAHMLVRLENDGPVTLILEL